MSEKSPRTSLFYYVPVVLITILVLVIVFLRNFRKGEETGSRTPRTESAPAEKSGVDLRALAKDTGLRAKGKTLFMINCASCHGPQGESDGDRAASLNPKPRNYKTEKFKFGSDIVSIYRTLQKGSPGTSMPSFALLPPEDVMAMAHYVYSLIPNPPPITDEQVASLPGAGGSQPAQAAGTAPASPMDTLFKISPRIPIQVAMERMTQAPEPVKEAARVNSSLPGAAIYAQRCAECHGEKGEGKPQRLLSVAPYRYERAASLSGSTAAWTKDRAKFAEIVTKGLPGRAMPGSATLTREEIDELYAFVKSLTP